VIRATVLSLLFSTTIAIAAGDWQKSLTPVEPGDFPIPRPLSATYRFGWSGFNAGEAEAVYSRKGDRLVIEVKGGTTGFVRSLWRLDATHTARASASTLRPISVRQLEIYRGETLRTELDFTSEDVTRLRESKPGPSAKRKRFKFPNLFDIHSALIFLRSQKLDRGDTYNIVVCPGGTSYLATATVVGSEILEVPAGRYKALKAELKLQKINRALGLEPHSKFKRGFVWISDDADRLLLKVQAEIFVGSVWMELQSVRR
jgi:hypothetical protein